MSYGSELGDDTKVRVSSSALVRILSKKVVRVIGIVVIALVIVYLCFAATIVRVIPSFSDTGFQVVKNITSEGGRLVEGDVIMANPSVVNNHGVGDYLRQAFLPSDNYILVEVQHGPFGEFDVDPETREVSHEGESTGLVLSERQMNDLDERDNMLLSEEYITLCISGNCEEGAAHLVSNENITGEVVELTEVDPVIPLPVVTENQVTGGEEG